MRNACLRPLSKTEIKYGFSMFGFILLSMSGIEKYLRTCLKKGLLSCGSKNDKYCETCVQRSPLEAKNC